MAFNRKQTVIHLHGQEASGVTASDLKIGEIIIVHPADGTAQFGTLNNAGSKIVWFEDYETTKTYVGNVKTELEGKINALENLTGTTSSALQLIEKGTDGTYVTTTISEKDADKKQKIGVTVTVQAVSGASETNKGLVEAYDVKSYVDSTKTALQGNIDAISKKIGDNVEANAQVNKIEKIQRNGTDLTITDKAVNIEVPTKASEIAFDGTHANTGFTGDNVKNVVENIENTILDNEKTTSAALNDLNAKIAEIPAATVTGVSANEKVLTLTDKNLSTTLGLAYAEATHKIQLTGIGDAVVAELDASAFIKDGMLTNAELVTNPSDDLIGTYIHLVWNTDGGDKSMYVNVTSLIDVYTAKENGGLTLDDHAFSVDTTVIATKASVDTLGTTVGNYTVNGKKISGNPVLGAGDIKVSDNETVAAAIAALGNKNVSATGDTYVSATAEANKVVVAATTALTEAVGKAGSAVQSVSVKNTGANNITATKSDDTKNVEFDFDSMIIDCGTF